ncbi:MAG: GyrI-like domain-containing protein [Spirochaetales bacterium]|nr:GyrI-like domain-containing protein [Spirochaetales bacterium]
MEIITKKEIDTLSVRTSCSVDKLPQTLGKAYDEVAALFGTDKITCTGAPFVIYYNMDMQNLDIEAGFPVSGATKDYGNVKRSRLPGGEQATAQHKGSYETLEKTYNALTEFCKENNKVPEDFMYEEYLNEPEKVSPDELLTNIYFILK